MAISRAAAQTKRNAAVRAQHAAKTKHGAGSKEHLAAMAVTRKHGDDMRAAVARGDHSHSPEGAVHTADLEAGRTPARTTSHSTAGTAGGSTATFKRTRGGYDPDTSLDYTNTNPAYWASAVSYFKANPRGNPKTGELGIWIPNLEKEGAERTALAAVAGGVTAHVNSNYSNRTVDDAYAKALHARRGDAAGAAGSYRGGAEKAIRLAGTHRGGTDVDTGYAMGSTPPSEHGAYIKGGKVIRGAGPDYVKGGGDFGGLLGSGTAINTSMLDGLLGARDSDGMRIGGTYPTVRGAATSDPARVGGFGEGMAGGSYGYGGGGISGGGPVVPTYMSDWSKFMPKNFSLGEAMYDSSGKEVAPGGFLYQPHTADYLGGMSTPGGFSGGAGYGGGYGGAGGLGSVPPVTYTPPPGAGAPGGALRIPDPAMLVGGTDVTRDGMTAGRHSTHLGAYESRPGVWVWGERPSGEGEASLPASRGPLTGLLAARGVPTMAGRWGGTDPMEGMDADAIGEEAGGMLGADGEPDGSGYGY